jgi:hypothetical protein
LWQARADFFCDNTVHPWCIAYPEAAEGALNRRVFKQLCCHISLRSCRRRKIFNRSKVTRLLPARLNATTFFSCDKRHEGWIDLSKRRCQKQWPKAQVSGGKAAVPCQRVGESSRRPFHLLRRRAEDEQQRGSVSTQRGGYNCPFSRAPPDHRYGVGRGCGVGQLSTISYQLSAIRVSDVELDEP